MGSSRSFWDWFTRNQKAVSAIGGGLATLAAGIWAVYTHFNQPPDKPSQPPGISQTVGDIQGRDVTVTQQIINVPPEQIKKLVKEALAENTAQLHKADPQEKQALLQERAALEAKYQDLAKAKEDVDKKLTEVAQALEDYKQEFSPAQIEEAKKALSQGQTKDAQQLFQTAFETGRQLAEKGKLQQAEAAFNLGNLAAARIDYAGARGYYEEAARLQPDNPSYLNAAGLILLNMGRYAEAASYLQRALNLREQSLPPDHPDVAASLNNLAGLYYSQGQYAKAKPLYQRALQIDEKALGSDHPDVATDLENYAALLRKTGREKEAAPLELRAQAIRAKHKQANPTSEQK